MVATAGLVEGKSMKPLGELEGLLKEGFAKGVFRIEITDLLSHQIRALQAVTIMKNLKTGLNLQELLSTCEAVLRLLGRTPDEAQTSIINLTSKIES